MNPPRERSAIIAAWVEEGPTELPESTRRAIAVDVRATRQSRKSRWARWRLPNVDRLTLLAMATAAAVVLALAGLAGSLIAPAGRNVGGAPTTPSASPAPSSAAPASAAPSSAAPTTLVIPPMQQTYFSELHGYTISYPAGWSSQPATQLLSPPAWKSAGSSDAPFDFLGAQERPPYLRAGSAPLPEALPNVDDWIDTYLTFGDPNCVPPRERQELISIDGAPGRLRDSCGEVEATVVLDGRVYMFTLWLGESVTNGRELFDALAATIDLRPEDAILPSQSPGAPGGVSVGERLGTALAQLGGLA